jgi:hypothetical protein
MQMIIAIIAMDMVTARLKGESLKNSLKEDPIY